MIKFADLVKTKNSSCAKCFAVLYALPCQLDAKIEKYVKRVGKPVFPRKKEFEKGLSDWMANKLNISISQ